VTNAGDVQSAITVRVGNYAFSPDGSVLVDPPLEPGRSARRWVTATPDRLVLDPRQSAQVVIYAKPPHIAAPGDHHALVLLAGEGAAQPGTVRVRAQVGVGVLVRVPHDLRRLIQPHKVTVARSAKVRVLRLGVTNKGNVNERLNRGQVRFQLRRGGRTLATVLARPRSFLPGTSGFVSARYTGPITGPVTVVATVQPTPAAQAGPSIQSTPPTVARTASLTL
jgi:hypothetical protein